VAGRSITSTTLLPSSGSYGVAVSLTFNVNGQSFAVGVTAEAQTGRAAANGQPAIRQTPSPADLLQDWNTALNNAGLGSRVTAELAGEALRFRQCYRPSARSRSTAVTGPATLGFAAKCQPRPDPDPRRRPPECRQVWRGQRRGLPFSLNGAVTLATLTAASQSTKHHGVRLERRSQCRACKRLDCRAR